MLASAHSTWFVIGLAYVLGVFAYGFEGRLETAESGFPVRLFVLPVRTSVLVGGPMLQGIVAALVLWLAWERLVLWPSGVVTQTWWTPMLAAVVAVSQAIVWWPFGLPWVRLFAAVAALIVLIRLPLFLALAEIEFDDPSDEERLLRMVALVLIPSSLIAAWFGVSRARRGDNPDWMRLLRFLPRGGISQQTLTPFRSALRAQVWYEWRLRGRGYVVTVACVLFTLLGLAILIERLVGWHINDHMILLIVPLMVAPFWGSVAGMSGEGIRSARLTAFGATRPLNNAALASAKFRAAGLAAVAAWALVFSVVTLWFFYTRGQEELGQMWERTVWRHGRDRAIVGCVVLVAGSVLLTWRMLVVGLWAGLTGRAWVVAAQSALLFLLIMQGLYDMAMWNDPERREKLLDALPWIAGGLIAVKLALAAWELRSLHRRGEFTTGMVGRFVAVWLVFTAALFGVTAWLILPSAVPTYGVALWAMLMVPLARLVIAPLALAWNRHR
jgi:hypothetical protein